MPDEVLAKLIQPVTWWFREAAKVLSDHYPRSFDKATFRFIDILSIKPPSGQSALGRTAGRRDWVTEAINSPVGHIAEAIFADSRLAGIRTAIDPSANWLGQLARLLALEGERRHYANRDPVGTASLAPPHRSTTGQIVISCRSSTRTTMKIETRSGMAFFGTQTSVLNSICD